MADHRPGALRAHVRTWRPYTLWYIGLVGLAGAALADGRHDWWRLAAAWATPTIGWIGGHYLGDYFDRDLDAASKPHRPIPSGALHPATALICGVACLVGVGALAVAGGWPTLTVAAFATVAIIAYGRVLKARGLAGNAARGALGALTLLYGAALVAPPTQWSLLPFVLAFWAHDTSSNLVGTLRDVAGDRAGGYLTMPVRHGHRVATATALSLYGLALASAGLGGWTGAHRTTPLAYLISLALAALLGAAAFRSLLAHRTSLPAHVALRGHELLVLERVCLAAAVVGLGLGLPTAGLLAVPALVVTGWTQARLRTRHEFGSSLPHLG